MKKILLNNWKTKMVCLIVAALLWYVIRENVTRDYARQNPANPASSLFNQSPALP